MAAGMGSRYGGLKQIDPVGPHGEIIIDYSMVDAVRAGFKKIVFVIRHSFEDAFREKIGRKLDGRVETAYAFQELDACLGSFERPAGRAKPWGTGHAILVSREVIDQPFAVINADDYYGPRSLQAMNDYLSHASKINPTHYAMIGFMLRNTLSDHGHVARGVCQVDPDMLLKKVTERPRIRKVGDGAMVMDTDGTEYLLRGDEVVSMNLWGFHPSIFGHLRRQFDDFLTRRGRDAASEFFIPAVVDRLIAEDAVTARVLTTQDRWFGVTYREDRPMARDCIDALIAQGVYPENLWDRTAWTT